MKVTSDTTFHDLEAGITRHQGDTWDCSAERGAYLVECGLVHEVKAAAPKPRARRTKKAEQ